MLPRLLAAVSRPTASELGVPRVTLDSAVTNVIQFLYTAVGALSVIFIIVGGFRYVTSAGNPERVGKAKNTILYAVIGLIFALAAFAIVNFVIEGVT